MKLRVAIFTILLLAIFWNREEEKIVPLANDVAAPKKQPTFQNLKPVPTEKFSSKPPMKINRVPSSDVDPSQESKPTDLPFEVNIEDQPLKIGRSFNLVKDIVTIEKANYKPEMGELLSENKNYVFFRPNSTEASAWPVALNRSTKRLYPISHILHVKGIDSTLREQFKSEGYKEFYYHPRMKFISLETTPATVIKQFQELTARGYEATLEVLKDPHQPK